MKVGTNQTVTSDKKMAVVWYDSHDSYWTFGYTKKMGSDMCLDEWENLLKTFPDSDVLFCPHPDSDYIDRNESIPWVTDRMRYLNKKYGNGRKIILQAFLWSFNKIYNDAYIIKQQGFTDVQITPVQGVKDDNAEFWHYYQPLGLDFYDSPIGNFDEYSTMISHLRELSLGVIQDVIFRHCAGNNTYQERLIPNYKVSDVMKEFWLSDKYDNDDYNDRWKCVNLPTGMPMMNIWDHRYQEECKKFLTKLKEVGITGFRLDQLKHYPTREEGCDFLYNVFNDFESTTYIYGEVLDYPRHMCDMYTKY